ncbi:hypothetical protein FQA39_LY11723 [Lamprigera yunnana]|nr:hypothetical protein FQA39_LY11723 [Lamprigera yunnana]
MERQEKAKRWLCACNRYDLLESDLYLKKNYRVCSAHFVPEQVQRTYPRLLLKPTAIPRLNINEEAQSSTIESVASTSTQNDNDVTIITNINHNYNTSSIDVTTENNIHGTSKQCLQQPHVPVTSTAERKLKKLKKTINVLRCKLFRKQKLSECICKVKRLLPNSRTIIAKVHHKNVAFCTLPRDMERQEKAKRWLCACNRYDLLESDLYLKKNYRVCSAHFVPEQVQRTYPRLLLKPTAIPRLNINEEAQSSTIESVASTSTQNDNDVTIITNINHNYNTCKLKVYRKNCIEIYLLFIFLNLIKTTNTKPPDLTFVIKNTNDTNSINLLCIGEGDVLNSAITWIYPIPDNVEKLPTIVSNFVPQRNKEYNCNFEKSKKCNNLWQSNGWQYSNFDYYNFQPILDPRWENFPVHLTSNASKEFNTRIDIPHFFEIGLSIRASRNSEIFICNGWNPKNYPCYYINIGGADNKQVFLKKYPTGVPEKFSKNETKLIKYKNDVSILAEDEWKTFSLAINNGTLVLKEVFNNIVMLNYSDKNPLQPMSLIVRSKNENALWKFHKNDFMYINKTASIKLGPELNLYGKELCISLYVLMCQQCTMKFFITKNNRQEIIKEVVNNKKTNITWEPVTLTQDDILYDSLQLFVEASFTNNKKVKNGFWAIDDVRVCTENELKMTNLNINMTFKDFQKTHITCQSLMHPNWRPIHHVAPSKSVDEVSCNTSSSTSIKLVWKPTVEETSFEEYSVIQYEGIDICQYDPNGTNIISQRRKKSKGFVVDKNNEIKIKNLVPYTSYNITFWNVIDDDKRFFEMHTLPTDIPTKEELPRILNKSMSDTTGTISWNQARCNETYGPVLYQVHILNKSGNDSRYYMGITSEYKFEDLQPFTNYTLRIQTSRKLENFNNTNLSIGTMYNFTTKPGIAPKVKNLELYSTDQNSASLRFDVPKHARGIPQWAQIRWCHPLFLSGCLLEIHNLSKCALWDSKYCIQVNSLVKNNEYKFSVSIKNQDTFSFGAEQTVQGRAIERVPGKPSNVSYKRVDCNKVKDICNLKITWAHPNKQNATITMFDIIFRESSYTLSVDALKSIHEILKIKDKQYRKVYSFVVKYVPSDTPYIISIRAVNDLYKGEFDEIVIETEDQEEYVDQIPEFIECTNETMKFKLPLLDRRLNSSKLIVIVQDYNDSKENIIDDIVKLEMFGNKYKLCNEFGNAWVAKTLTVSNSLYYIPQLRKNIFNKSLKPNTEYCITFALLNQHNDSETLAVFHAKHLFTQRNSVAQMQENVPTGAPNAAAYVVPIVLIIALLGVAMWYIHKYILRRRLLSGEHIYESMPFDDYVPDAVSNQNYDRLIHN